MPFLTIEQPGQEPRTIPLRGDEMSFGRASDNDVVLVAEEISRHHARLRRHGRKVAVEDLDSLNGVYVNRRKVKSQVLAHEDEIWFGGNCRILFQDDIDLPTERPEERPESTILKNNMARIRAKMNEVASQMTMLSSPDADHVEAATTYASAEELMDMGRAYRRLDALYRATKLIASEFDLHKRLASVLDIVMEVLSAERGFVMLRDEATGNLDVSVARGMGHELESGAPSMSIARRAALAGEPVLTVDAGSDHRFAAHESIISQQIVSAMCVPMQIEDRILGSVYVDTRKTAFAFDEADLELFASMAAQSAMAIDNVRLHESMIAAERKRANLGRFLSPAIVDEVMKEESTLALGGRKRVVTSMFCDIRGFTPLTERIAPVEIVDLLNEHFTAMTEVIFAHQGTLDKYIGDEIMAVFGAPILAEDDAERAVRAALEMQARNAELNEIRAAEGRPSSRSVSAWIRARSSPATSARSCAWNSPWSAIT
ncbi:MAG TPA: FHA domain-containing protein [Candidatus Hydrogenedentes bacterium]|nr:FHA domain-containing protein [Candidatus Hydrogenedentota bacterium]